MKVVKKILREVLEMFVIILIVSAVSLLLTYIISIYKNSNFKDTLSWVALTIAIFGGLSLLKGNPTGMNMGSIGMDSKGSGSQTYDNYVNMEVTRMERSITKYGESTKNHGMMQFKNRRFYTLLGGIILYVVSVFI